MERTIQATTKAQAMKLYMKGFDNKLIISHYIWLMQIAKDTYATRVVYAHDRAKALCKSGESVYEITPEGGCYEKRR